MLRSFSIADEEAGRRLRPARGLPAWTYRNPELLELEYERVILPSWQFVCHENQLRMPGDFATLELKRDPVLVVRDEDGALRGFLNVCRHRGTRLLDGTGSCRARIACPYHGWTYGLDGRLLAVPAERTFPGIYKIEKGELTLTFTEKGDRPKEFKVDGEAMLLKMKKEEKK